MRVTLGNPHPLRLPAPENRVTTVAIPDSDTLDEAFRTVTDRDGVWANHSHADAPAWVESDDADFADRLAAHYGISVGRPDEWEDETP